MASRTELPIETGNRLFLVAVFVVAVFGVALSQVAVELARGERIGVLGLFQEVPREESLRRFEKRLDDACWVAPLIRPVVQLAQFAVLDDCGEKAVRGREGWFFYKPEVQYLVEPWPPRAGGPPDDPVAAILDFRDQLAARGIALVVVPAPDKASIYPEMLTARAASADEPVNPATPAVLARLAAAGVEVVDLFEVFARAKADARTGEVVSLYLAQDTHWSPEGVRLAAEAVARRILDRGWIARGPAGYVEKSVTVSRRGDVLQMVRVPQIERRFPPETILCSQVVRSEDGSPYADDPPSPVLVLGDSFLRIYQRDEPGAAGFVAHLARALRQPATSVVNDGGASTLVRQELYRRPALLAGKRVVVWEFVERDLRFGTEGWQRVPLR